MTDLKPPELFSQRPEHMQFVHEQFARAEIARMRSYRIRRFLTCAILAIALCGLIYEIVAWNSKPAEIPTIEADGALKQKPEQPGGLDVPNQDVLAYQQLDNSGAGKPDQDHMLPPPETPQPSPPADNSARQLPTAPAVTLPPVPKVEDLSAPSVDALAPAPVTQPPAVISPPQPASPPPPPPAKTAEAAPQAPAPAKPAPPKEEANDNAVPAAPAVVAAPSPAKSAASGKKNYRVQLASFPDKEEADREMGRMQEKFGEQLGDARLHLAKADLGARGIFYRVQSNPITSDDARDICAALKKLKAGCIIVKP